ncbi:MAG: AAA family ATPase [Verrucomicrobiales bacterium]
MNIHDFKTLVLSSHPLIAVETVEEERAQALVEAAAADLCLPLFTWSIARGLAKHPSMHAVLASTNSPLKALRHIEDLALEGIYLFKDFCRHLEDPVVLRQLRENLQHFANSRSCFVLTAPDLHLPREVEHHAVHFDLKLPCKEELKNVMQTALDSLKNEHSIRVELDSGERENLLEALGGLTLNQARQRVASAMIEDGVLDGNDISRIHRSKAKVIKDSGLLEYFPVQDNQFELGGFDNLKDWMERAAVGFTPRAKALNLSPPRGILLVGVQGCGKSLAAKAIARKWDAPLLKLDAGCLYDKFIGESERNLRKAIRLAESLSPVVLWIDEIEKAFVTGDGGAADGGTSLRMLGTLLTWLQEKKDSVFVVGTANNLDLLPSELLRKGRFDEIFFVDLPNFEERREILSIHLEIHHQPTVAFELDHLAYATDGFSGSEIEQVIVASLYRALFMERPLDTDILVREIVDTVPLSVSRAEDLERMRSNARGRFVPVRAEPDPATLPAAG